MLKRFLATPIRHFVAAQSGKAAVLFGLALVPLAGLVGAACDYTRAATARAEMQAVADETAIMLAQQAQGQGAAAIRQKAEAYFRSHYQRHDVAGLEVAAAYDDADQHMAVTTQGRLNTDFMSLFGVEIMTVQVQAAAVPTAAAVEGKPAPQG